MAMLLSEYQNESTQQEKKSNATHYSDSLAVGLIFFLFFFLHYLVCSELPY